MRDQRGFTLLEILVALVLIGLLAGVLMPTVVNQLSRGETNRITEDLGAIEDAAKSFRVDVQRWPWGLNGLVTPPEAGDSVFGGTIPTGLVDRWKGPYLERGSIPGDTLVTAAGAVILPKFTITPWGATSFISVRVRGVTQETASAIRMVVDGDTQVGDTATPAVTGKVRWETGDVLVYLIAPV